jgi:hypothetical protein
MGVERVRGETNTMTGDGEVMVEAKPGRGRFLIGLESPEPASKAAGVHVTNTVST